MFRAIMNASPTWYTPYVVGNNYIQYNPSGSCGGTVVNILNRATQALYNYTPYQPNDYALGGGSSSAYPQCGAFGNRNFYTYYQSWFGAPRGDYCVTDQTASKTTVLFGKDGSRNDFGKFIITSGASTGCVESHSWTQGFGSWKDHVATGAASTNLADATVQFADLDGNGKDEMIFVGYRNTGSGKVEFHVLSDDMKTWKGHYISNSDPVDPALSQISFADLDGDGKDEAILIGLMDGSTSTGKIELHVWNPGFTSWKAHYISNSSTITQALSQLSFADLDGNGKDEGILIGVANGGTSTGMIEFHVWNEGFGSWKGHYVSNSQTIDRSVSKVDFADIDGDGKDDGVLVGLKATGSGMIEFHTWSEGFGSWRGHFASNQAGN